MQIQINGKTFIVSIEQDIDHGAPWDESECTGVVSEWTTRDKKPGERVLSVDGRYKRFYDVKASIAKAKAQGWGVSGDVAEAMKDKTGFAPTRREIRAEAVRRDFEFLQGWCLDHWHYVGVCVRHTSQPENEKYNYSVWGIESNYSAGIQEIAKELAEQCAADIAEEIAKNKNVLSDLRRQFHVLASEVRKTEKLAPAICAAVRAQLGAIAAKRMQLIASNAELNA